MQNFQSFQSTKFNVFKVVVGLILIKIQSLITTNHLRHYLIIVALPNYLLRIRKIIIILIILHDIYFSFIIFLMIMKLLIKASASLLLAFFIIFIW